MTRLDEVVKAFAHKFVEIPHVHPTGCFKPDYNGLDCGRCAVCKHRVEFTSNCCEVCNIPLETEAYELLVALDSVGPLMSDDGPTFYFVCKDCYYFAAYGEVMGE